MDQPIRVAIIGLPPLIRELVRDLIAGNEDMAIVERGDAADGVDVCIVGTEEDAVSLCDVPRMSRPPRVIGISSDGRRTTLCELRPVVSALGDLSPDELLDVIRGVPR